MTKNHWHKIHNVPFREMAALCDLPENAAVKELLAVDYQHVTIGGAPCGDWLLNVFYLAVQDATDAAVTAYLCALDSTDDLTTLAYEVFLPLSVAQKKKTAFVKIIKDELRRREKREKEAARELKKLDKQAFLATQPPYYGKKLTQEVVEQILNELGVMVRLNLVTKRIELHGNTGTLHQLYSEENIMTTFPTLILDVCKNNEVSGGAPSMKAIDAYLFNLADANRYNPIQDMLKVHENTDESRLQLVYDILGLTLNYDKMLVKKWLIQTVAFAFATVREPVSTEGVLVLQGEQGGGKTSFFRKMAGNPLWFTEGAVIDMRNKDTLISAIGSWICELGEIDSTLKKEQSALKAFITRTVDRIRLPYAPAESEIPRTTSMCGTVNPEQFLKDTTGNRRYWTVHVDKIDKERLFALEREEIFEIWGYIYHLYLQDKDSYRLNDAELKKLEVHNRDYEANLSFEEEVRELLDFFIEEPYWQWVSPAALVPYLHGARANQIGKVLTKIEKEEYKVQKRRCAAGYQYYVPLQGWISERLGKPICTSV